MSEQIRYDGGSGDDSASTLLYIRRALGELTEAIEDLAETSCADACVMSAIRQRLARVRAFALLG